MGPNRKWNNTFKPLERQQRLLSSSSAGFSFKMLTRPPGFLPRSLALTSWCSFLSSDHHTDDERWFLVVNRQQLVNGHRRIWTVIGKMKIFQGGRGVSRWDGAPWPSLPCYCWKIHRKPHKRKSWAIYELGHLWFEFLTSRSQLDMQVVKQEGDHL